MRKGQQAPGKGIRRAGAHEPGFDLELLPMPDPVHHAEKLAAEKRAGRPRGQNNFELANRRTIAARMYLQGRSIYEISQAVGVAVSTVSNDLDHVRRTWLRAMAGDMNEVKSRELAKLDALEASYWDAWAKSREEGVVEETYRNKYGDTARSVRTVSSQAGDPRFLAGIERCMELRAKILGLFVDPRAAIPTQSVRIEVKWGNTPALIDEGTIIEATANAT